MSTATKEPPATVPLGSFITKLTPKAVEKPVDKPVDVVADAPKAAAVVETKPEEKKTEVQKEAPPTELKPEEKPKDDVVEKRLKDTQRSWHEEHKARLDAERREAELQSRLERIEKKLDGTYEEPALPTSDQVATDADTKGRIRASHHAAVRQYGEQFVMETVWNQDSPYMVLQSKSPRLRERVMQADDPVLEAIAVVKEHQDGEKYGRTPEEIRKKMEAELAPKLKQEILEGLKTKPGPATNTLGNVRGGSERAEQKSDAPARLDFRAVFPWGASRQ
jgi:hypothetical protein